MLRISQLIDQALWEYEFGNRSYAQIMLDHAVKLTQKRIANNVMEKLVDSKGIKAQTTFRKCLEAYNDLMFDLSGNWNFTELVSPQILLQELPEEILSQPVVIDGKHVVINVPGTGIEVFNMIPSDLIHTTVKEKK